MLKWAATGFSVLLFLMSLQCPLRRIWKGVLCFSHILLLASPALDEVDDIARLAGGCI